MDLSIVRDGDGLALDEFVLCVQALVGLLGTMVKEGQNFCMALMSTAF